jgi:ATP-dependent helicase HrpA
MANPGLRRELVIALIKSLPKPVRRNFVPAPNYAEAFLGRVTPLELPLLDALEREFRRMTGTTIDREDWNWDQVPDHLKISFRVVDDKNKKLLEGRSLSELKEALKGKVQETLLRWRTTVSSRAGCISGALVSFRKATSRSAVTIR